MNTDFFMDSRCFACGRDNEKGLHLDIKESSDGVRAAFHIPAWCQGYEKVTHGGIVSTILDELAVWAAYKAGHKCVTAEITVRIKKPMKTDIAYIGRGSVKKQRHRFIQAYAEIVDDNNQLCARAHLKLMKIQG